MGEKNLLKQDSSIEEKELNPISGWIALFIGILFILSPVFGFINLVNTENDIFLIVTIILFIVAIFIFCGLKIVNPKADKTILNELGLKDDEIKRNVLKLSGGQQQRVAIARTLVANSPVILADEPTGNLDSDTEEEIIEILKTSAHKHGKCVIVVTHSKDLASKSDVILELKDKKLVL